MNRWERKKLEKYERNILRRMRRGAPKENDTARLAQIQRELSRYDQKEIERTAFEYAISKP